MVVMDGMIGDKKSGSEARQKLEAVFSLNLTRQSCRETLLNLKASLGQDPYRTSEKIILGLLGPLFQDLKVSSGESNEPGDPVSRGPELSEDHKNKIKLILDALIACEPTWATQNVVGPQAFMEDLDRQEAKRLISQSPLKYTTAISQSLH